MNPPNIQRTTSNVSIFDPTVRSATANTDSIHQKLDVQFRNSDPLCLAPITSSGINSSPTHNFITCPKRNRSVSCSENTLKAVKTEQDRYSSLRPSTRSIEKLYPIYSPINDLSTPRTTENSSSRSILKRLKSRLKTRSVARLSRRTRNGSISSEMSSVSGSVLSSPAAADIDSNYFSNNISRNNPSLAPTPDVRMLDSLRISSSSTLQSIITPEFSITSANDDKNDSDDDLSQYYNSAAKYLESTVSNVRFGPIFRELSEFDICSQRLGLGVPSSPTFDHDQQLLPSLNSIKSSNSLQSQLKNESIEEEELEYEGCSIKSQSDTSVIFNPVTSIVPQESPCEDPSCNCMGINGTAKDQASGFNITEKKMMESGWSSPEHILSRRKHHKHIKESLFVT